MNQQLLIVEDEELLCLSLAKSLKKSGYGVEGVALVLHGVVRLTADLDPNPPPNSGSRLSRKAQRLRCLHRFDAQRSLATPALKSARCFWDGRGCQVKGLAIAVHFPFWYRILKIDIEGQRTKNLFFY